jgi:hypothetical protein
MVPLLINGISVASPVSGSWDDASLATSESGRDNGGNMNLDITTEKKNFPYSWGWLTAAETSTLLKAVKLKGIADIDITVHDPENNVMKTYNCYAGDRHVPIGTVIGDAIYYNGISITFIEN